MTAVRRDLDPPSVDELRARINLALSLLRSRLGDQPASVLVEQALLGASIRELMMMDRRRTETRR